MTDILAEKLIAWRRELHQYPELSNNEYRTTKKITEWLRGAGIDILPLPLKTGVAAQIGHHAGPTIALRADIDALPIDEQTTQPFISRHKGVMHACGHDVHTSIMLGAALLLKARESQLAGNVHILFQPAEETFNGANQLIDAGALQGVSAIFGGHNAPGLPVGEFATRSGPMHANVDRFEILVRGKGAHAAASARWTRYWSASRGSAAATPGTYCLNGWSWKAPCEPTTWKSERPSRKSSPR